ncbi:MAG: universal stress protein [Flavobacteriia bacterium]|nr:universal stress protein [Flavobacteriia bacterium]
MKHILVPTDFSKTSEIAIDFAIHAAELLKAKITLLNSFEVAEGSYTDLMGVNREFTNDLINEAKIKLNDLRIGFMKKSEVDIQTAISVKPLADAINEVSEEGKVDLVIMGTLGATGLKTKLWGSHTSDVIGKTKIPVMAIPSDYKWKKPQNILLATRQFERNDEILDYLFEMTFLFSASVKTAVFTGNDQTAEVYVKHQQELQNYAEFLKNEYRDDTLSSVHLIGDSFEETLEDYISKNQVDLLTMITYQEGFWKSLFNPSLTKQMSFHTRIPLLVIPANFSK